MNEVHFFKPNGKWYTCEKVSWFYRNFRVPESDPEAVSFAEVIESYTRSFDGKHRLAGMTAVCTGTNPLGFPQMCVVPA